MKKPALEGLHIIKNELLNYKKELIVLGVLAVFAAVIDGVVPYLVGQIIDSIALPGKTIFIFLIIWGCVNLVSDVLSWQAGIRREKLGVRIETDYITKGFSKLLEKPMSFHKTHKIGNITHRIMRAGGSLELVVGRIIIDLAPQFLSILVATGITFYVNPVLCLALVFTMAVYILILKKNISPIFGIQNKMHFAYQRAYGDSFDIVYNTQTVKQAVAETREKRNLQKIYGKAVTLYGQLIVIWNSLNFYQRLLALITQVIIFTYSIFAIRQGAMTIGELVMFSSYAAMIFGPFVILGNNWQIVQRAITSLTQANKVLSLPPEKYVPENAVLLSEIKGDISFQNVSFYYKKTNPILKNISFEIRQGEKVALVGESGVGKTTLIDLLCGYHFAKAGKVLVDGVDIKKQDLKFLRKNISIVPQEIMLFNESVKYNIRYGNFKATDEEIAAAARLAHADEFIEKFPKKYGQVVGERGIKLSAGQKQRIAIARALLHDPKILILDEPTSSLDAASEQLIQESLEKLMEGRTTLIIAHRLSTVRKADKIIVLKDGEIAESGRHDELIKIKDGVYRRLYNLQFGLK